MLCVLPSNPPPLFSFSFHLSFFPFNTHTHTHTERRTQTSWETAAEAAVPHSHSHTRCYELTLPTQMLKNTRSLVFFSSFVPSFLLPSSSCSTLYRLGQQWETWHTFDRYYCNNNSTTVCTTRDTIRAWGTKNKINEDPGREKRSTRGGDRSD